MTVRATEKQQLFARCVIAGMGNYTAAKYVGYLPKHSGRIRKGRGVENELQRLRGEMIDKTHFTKEFMINKLYAMMGRMESAIGGSDELQPKEQRECLKTALEIGKEINKMLGHYTPLNSQHLRVESSASELSQLIERIDSN